MRMNKIYIHPHSLTPAHITGLHVQFSSIKYSRIYFMTGCILDQIISYYHKFISLGFQPPRFWRYLDPKNIPKTPNLKILEKYPIDGHSGTPKLHTLKKKQTCRQHFPNRKGRIRDPSSNPTIFRSYVIYLVVSTPFKILSKW